MPFQRGQILLAHVDDGHGNRKQRPVVVVMPPEDIVPGEPLRVICVSTQIDDPIPSHHVPLPWMRPRHPRTGLDKPNVAKCDWPAVVAESDVIKPLGFVPSDHLAKIRDAITRLRDPDANREE